MDADSLPPDCLSLLSRIQHWGRIAVPITVANAKQSGDCLRALYGLGLIELRQATADGNSVDEWQSCNHPTHTSAMADALHHFLNPPSDADGPVRGTVTVRVTDAGIAALMAAHARREQPRKPKEPEHPQQSAIPIDEVMQSLSELDRRVLRTIHDFECAPYPNVPEKLEGIDEPIASKPRPTSPVPDYIIRGVAWPANPDGSLRALQEFGLIRQPQGQHLRFVHCILPDGRTLKAVWKTKPETKEDNQLWESAPKGEHLLWISVSINDDGIFGSFGRDEPGKPNAYTLTSSGLRVSRKIFSPESGGAKPPLEGTPDRGSDNKNALLILHDQFAVELNGKRCELGNTLQFKLLKRLEQSTGRYVAISELEKDVWKELAGVEKNTIQQVVTKLRKALKKAGLQKEILIDGKQTGYYRLQVGPMIDD